MHHQGSGGTPGPLKDSAEQIDPERIIGATFEPSNGEIVFLMKLKHSNDAKFVKAKMANIKFPELVIEFYQKNLFWVKNEGDTDSDD